MSKIDVFTFKGTVKEIKKNKSHNSIVQTYGLFIGDIEDFPLIGHLWSKIDLWTKKKKIFLTHCKPNIIDMYAPCTKKSTFGKNKMSSGYVKQNCTLNSIAR